MMLLVVIKYKMIMIDSNLNFTEKLKAVCKYTLEIVMCVHKYIVFVLGHKHYLPSETAKNSKSQY